MTRKRLVLLLLGGLISLYLTAYLINSLSGGYRWLIVSSINHQTNDASNLDLKLCGGAIAWQPRYGNYTRTSGDHLGKFFYPLIFLDQTFWHRDIPASEIQSREWLKKQVPLSQVHPEDLRLYDEISHFQ